jgi:hypothetical protein
MVIFKKDKKEHRPATATLRCSFCSKSENDVGKLIAGPKVYICDECVNLCNDIIAEEKGEPKRRAEEPRPISPTGISCALCRFPVEADESIMIPDRGPLCPTCLSAIKAVMDAENHAQKEYKKKP